MAHLVKLDKIVINPDNITYIEDLGRYTGTQQTRIHFLHTSVIVKMTKEEILQVIADAEQENQEEER